MKNLIALTAPELYSPAQIALINAMSRDGKNQAKADLQAGKLKFITYNSKFIFEIADAAQGIIKLFDITKNYLEGVIPEEWHKGVLQDGYNIAVSHLGLGFVADGSVATPAAAIAFASIPSGWPAALRNGRLSFSQQNTNPVFIQCESLGSNGTALVTRGEKDMFELVDPLIFLEGKPTSIELRSADSQAFASPGGGNYLELRTFGCALVPRK